MTFDILLSLFKQDCCIANGQTSAIMRTVKNYFTLTRWISSMVKWSHPNQISWVQISAVLIENSNYNRAIIVANNYKPSNGVLLLYQRCWYIKSWCNMWIYDGRATFDQIQSQDQGGPSKYQNLSQLCLLYCLRTT